MNPSAYQRSAARTEAPASGVRERLGSLIPEEMERLLRINHAALGMLTEAGEFGNTIKKSLYYGKPLDILNAKEELGDLIWYVAIACEAFGFDLGGIMTANIAKLTARFPNKFTEHQADPDNRDLDKEALAAAQAQIGDKYRTPAEVLVARATVHGCCNRHADNQSCDCLEQAQLYVRSPKK